MLVSLPYQGLFLPLDNIFYGRGLQTVSHGPLPTIHKLCRVSGGPLHACSPTHANGRCKHSQSHSHEWWRPALTASLGQVVDTSACSSTCVSFTQMNLCVRACAYLPLTPSPLPSLPHAEKVGECCFLGLHRQRMNHVPLIN